MANIMFKRGLQASLPTQGQDGCFYLTTDTHRLYVGQGTNVVPVNQGVINVANVNSLPKDTAIEAGQFYYAQSENVLCVYNGNQWVQINPDTNDNDVVKVTEVTVADPAVTANDKIVYNATLKQTQYNKSGSAVKNLDDVSFNLTLNKDDLESIIHDPASVGLNVTSGSNSAIINTKGTGSDSTQTATIKGGSNVTVSQESGIITVTAADSQYELKSLTNNNKATVRLEGKGSASGNNKDVVFAAGKDMVVSADSSAVTFAHAEISTTNDTATSATTLTHNGEVDVVTGVTTSNGHVTKVTTQKYKLPADTSIKQINGTATSGADADWKVEIEENIGGKKFGIDFSKDAEKLKSDLQKEISDGLAAANTALTYKGTVSKESYLSLKSNVEIGEVYMLDSEDGTYKVGDLFIATVESDSDHTNGVIVEGKVQWTYVPSGNELNTDTLFYGDVTVTAGNGTGGSVAYALKAKRGAEGDNPSVPTENENLTISGGTDILVSGSGTSATINHKVYDAVTPNNAPASSKSTFKAITGLTLANGHVTGINTQDFTPETYALSGANNKIQLKNGSGSDVGYVSVEGDNWIGASVASNKVSITHNGPVTTNPNDQSVTNKTNLNHGDSLNLITGVKYDDNGHIVEVATGSVTLPSDTNVNTTYDLFLGSASNSKEYATTAATNPYVVLRNNSGENDTVQFKGDGSVAVNGVNNAVTISMVWGSF